MACVKRMEIPTDVAGIISEYAKPRMRFSGEYNRCVRELKQANQKDNWPTLKKRLCDKDADKVIQAYVAHTEAKLATYTARVFFTEVWRKCEPNHYHYQHHDENIQYRTASEEVLACVKREFSARCALMDVLYGIKNDLFHKCDV